MSSDLSVKIVKNIEIHSVLNSGERILQEMLMLSNRPTLVVEQLHDGRRTPISGKNMLKSEIGTAIIRFQDEREEIGLVMTQIEPHPKLGDSEEVGLWAFVVVGAMRTPLEFILAASVAIALAKETGTKVLDDGLIWSSVIENKAEDLLQTLQLRRKISNLHLAAEEIYNAMPRGIR